LLPLGVSTLMHRDAAQELQSLKQQNGPALHVHGSANLIQPSWAHDLVDDFLLAIFPITLGTGQRLFAEGTTAVAFAARQVKTSLCEVIVASYKRAGGVQTGSYS